MGGILESKTKHEVSSAENRTRKGVAESVTDFFPAALVFLGVEPQRDVVDVVEEFDGTSSCIEGECVSVELDVSEAKEVIVFCIGCGAVLSGAE